MSNFLTEVLTQIDNLNRQGNKLLQEASDTRNLYHEMVAAIVKEEKLLQQFNWVWESDLRIRAKIHDVHHKLFKLWRDFDFDLILQTEPSNRSTVTIDGEKRSYRLRTVYLHQHDNELTIHFQTGEIGFKFIREHGLHIDISDILEEETKLKNQLQTIADLKTYIANGLNKKID